MGIRGTEMVCSICKKKKLMHVKGLCRKCYDFKNRDRINKQRRLWCRRNKEKIRKIVEMKRFGGNKQIALERDNFECQMCGMNQEQSIVIFGYGLIVHHKDGCGRDQENPNNDLDNLITVCFRCHQKVHKELREEGIVVSDTRGKIRKTLLELGLIGYDNTEYEYPKLRKLLLEKKRKLKTIGKAKKEFSEETGISYTMIDKLFYDRRGGTN